MVKEDLADAFDAVFEQNDTRQQADDGPRARATWHVELDGEEVGPLTLAEVGRHIETGRVDPTTRVWRRGMPEWASAGDVAEIDALFVAPPIPERKRTSQSLAALVDAELTRERTPEAPMPAVVEPIVSSAIPEPLHVAGADAPGFRVVPVAEPRSALAIVLAIAGAAVAAAVVAGIVVVVTHEKPRIGYKGNETYYRDATGAWHPLQPSPATTPPTPTPPLSPPTPAPPTVAVVAPVAPVAPSTVAPPPVAPVVPAAHAVAPPKPPKPPKAPPPPKPPVSDDSEDCRLLGLCKGGATTTPAKEAEGLPQTAVLAVARDHLPQIYACGAKYGGTGLARMGWKVQPNGSVVDVKVLDAPLQGTQLGACISNTIASWKFPAAPGPTKVGSLPLRLTK